jgi:hypothetical protein
MSNIKSAFFNICKDAKPAESAYVSLYISIPFYGGPEEGGWWGSDVELVASEKFTCLERAEAGAKEVQRMADILNRDAKNTFYERCRAECDWLEARGLDDDFLPEVDGETSYFVVVEEYKGSRERKGDRQYS